MSSAPFGSLPATAVSGDAPAVAAAGTARHRRLLTVAVWAVLLAAAFAANLRLSQTIPGNSDSAGPPLQGWDMLHGNLLQHGWITADVPYFPTEVTEYALVDLVHGLGPGVIHWGGALTYTLAMALAALLAMGKAGQAPGGQRIARGALAAGIMIAPQLDAGTYTLLLGPDHFGTAVPILAAWLLADRAPRRWYVPALCGLIIGVTGIADLTALFIGAVPLAGVYGYRALRETLAGRAALASQRHELAMAAAGLVAAALAVAGPHLLTAIGSVYHAAPLTRLSPLHTIVTANLRVTGQCLLILAGADFIGLGHQHVQAALAVLHLAGAAAGAAAIAVAAWRFARDKDVISQLVVAGIALNLLAFVAGTHAVETSYAREISPVLTLGAALAGRLLAGPLLAGPNLAGRLSRRQLAIPALAVLAAGYLAGFGYELRQPVVPSQNAAVIPFLRAHHLTYGLSGYWGADIITLDTAGQVQVLSLNRAGDKFTPSEKLDRPDWYDPRQHNANFLLFYQGPAGTPPFSGFTGVTSFYFPQQAIATFGSPSHTYHYRNFTIMTWDKNLLADLKFPALPG